MTPDAREPLEDILHAIDEADRRLGEQVPDDALHVAPLWRGAPSS